MLEKFNCDEVIKVFVIQWDDTSSKVRISVIKCLGQILKRKANKNISDAFEFLKRLICAQTLDNPYNPVSQAENNQYGQSFW